MGGSRCPRSVGGPAAIDEKRRAGDESGRLRGQKHDRVHQVLDRADPTELDPRTHGIMRLRAQTIGPGKRRINQDRRYGVDADAGAAEFDGERLDHAFYGEFRRYIERTFGGTT